MAIGVRRIKGRKNIFDKTLKGGRSREKGAGRVITVKNEGGNRSHRGLDRFQIKLSNIGMDSTKV